MIFFTTYFTSSFTLRTVKNRVKNFVNKDTPYTRLRIERIRSTARSRVSFFLQNANRT